MTAPEIEGMDHLTFPVGDLNQAEAFYIDMLGATLIRRFDSRDVCAREARSRG